MMKIKIKCKTCETEIIRHSSNLRGMFTLKYCANCARKRRNDWSNNYNKTKNITIKNLKKECDDLKYQLMKKDMRISYLEKRLNL